MNEDDLCRTHGMNEVEMSLHGADIGSIFAWHK